MPTPPHAAPLRFELDGVPVEVPDDGASLLEVLRSRLGVRTAKDGCAPQGQCGCCTVLVDGAARVACVTPARRVRGRSVTTVTGLGEAAERWAGCLLATGGSQCGFCTPGIVVRLEAAHRAGEDLAEPTVVHRGLRAHLCRCTGWQTITEAAARYAAGEGPAATGRDLDAASVRAGIEGRSPQRVAPEVALGEAGFAEDLAPQGALVALPDGRGGWAVGESLAEVRAAVGAVQGRRTTEAAEPPLEVPAGAWSAALRTSWVEPAYLETDASWCLPGGEPATPLANGGAFGGKLATAVAEAARRLADAHGRPVRALLRREDVVRTGPKRPPLAGGARADGTGLLRVARTPGVAEAVASVAPGLVVEEVDLPGPPTSSQIRAAGWAEALALLAGARGAPGVVRSPDGAEAEAAFEGGRLRVRVRCGDPLDEVVLRSYCIGAAHMALSWVTSEQLAVGPDGEVADLTIRSFGVLRAPELPPIEVQVDPGGGPPVNGSDAVFAAVAAATWVAQGCPPAWPTRLPVPR